MRKLLIILLVLALIAGGAWLVLRDGGALEQVTEARVEAALLDARLPPEMAECMAPRLVDDLTIAQLRELEQLAPEDGELRVPLSTGQALARLRVVADNEAVRTMVEVAGGCGFDLMIGRF